MSDKRHELPTVQRRLVPTPAESREQHREEFLEMLSAFREDMRKLGAQHRREMAREFEQQFAAFREWFSVQFFQLLVEALDRRYVRRDQLGL